MIVLEEQSLIEIKKKASCKSGICCGAIAGFYQDNKWIAQKFIPLENEIAENKSARFLISPENYLLAEEEAASHGLTLLGFYYTTADQSAIPAESNLKFALPSTLYLIVKTGGKDISFTGWTIDEDRKKFNNEKVEVVVSLTQLALAV